jgi:hypothetical protein
MPIPIASKISNVAISQARCDSSEILMVFTLASRVVQPLLAQLSAAFCDSGAWHAPVSAFGQFRHRFMFSQDTIPAAMKMAISSATKSQIRLETRERFMGFTVSIVQA